MSYTFNYSYNHINLTAIIIGFTITGEPSAPTDINIPKNTIFGGNTYSVIAITDDCFYKNNLITGISFETNSLVTTIGTNAFASCYNLKTLDLTHINTNVTIGDGAFIHCECLNNIISPINNPVIYVDKVSGYLYNTSAYVLYNKNNLICATSNISGTYKIKNNPITNYNTITINSYAFYKCIYLSTIDFSNATNLTTINQNAFNKCYKLSNIILSATTGITTINGNAFKETNITKFIIPPKLSTIGDGIFGFCKITYIGNDYNNSNYYVDKPQNNGYVLYNNNTLLLSTINISGTYKILNGLYNNININVSTIKSYAFNLCTQLTNISYNNSDITSIGSYAFGYSGITSINILNNLSNIGIASYAYCNISDITNTNNNSKFYIDTVNTNQKVLYFKNTNTNPNTTQLYIATNNISDEYKILNPFSGSNTTTICDFAFAGCNKLTKINLDNVKLYLTQINPNAFINCISLNNFDFTVLSGLQIIDINSFFGCISLQTIDLSQNNALTTINDDAFLGCSITTITIPSNVQTIGSNPFAKCPLINIINNSNNFYLHNLGNNKKILYSKTDLLTTTNNIDGEYSILNGIYNGYKIYINYISDATFYNCTGLNLINISNCKYLYSINSYAFYNCNISSLNILSTIKKLNEGCFAKCPIRQIINNSPYFYLDNNNVLYDSTNLIIAVKNISNTYNLLNGIYNNFSININYINDYAFYNCVNLTNINLLNASNLNGIGGNAFENCININSLVIPESINIINNKAFANMTKLNSVTFLGKPPQIVGFNLYSTNTTYTNLYNIIHGITNIPYNNNLLQDIIISLNTFIDNSIYTNVLIYILFASNDVNNIFYNDNNLTVIYYTSQYAGYWVPRPSWINANIQLLEIGTNNTLLYINQTSINAYLIQNNKIFKLRRYFNGKLNNTIIKPFYLQDLTPLLTMFIPPKK